MSRYSITCGVVALMLVTVSMTWAGQQSYSDPAVVDEDFAFQGEYVGELGDEKETVGVQVIALGKGRFTAVRFPGGLPGAGWNGQPPVRQENQGERVNDAVTISDESLTCTIKEDQMTVVDSNGNSQGTLKKITRVSPTENKRPVDGAVVLFDGKNADQWENGKLTADGLLQQGTKSVRKFGSQLVHIEFRLPYQPEARGQGRGNSGIYLQGRFEIQMLDSFGLAGKNNECGGLYSVKDCDLNMCFPPLSWQTYDIEYTAAQYDGDTLLANPRITVFHNGVKIHDDVELPGERNTTAAPVNPGPEPGPIYLQDHGNPVRYRNIWVLETDK